MCVVMRNALLEATSVPRRPSRRHSSVHVSHSCFTGLQHGSRSGSQLTVETRVLPFCSSHWSHKGHQNYFPHSTQDLCQHPMVVGCQLLPERRCHQPLWRPHPPRRARLTPSRSALPSRSNPRSARCTVVALPLAISSIGAFRTPAVGARG